MWRKRVNRRVHPVWCVGWFCIGVLVGIAISGTALGKLFLPYETIVVSLVCLFVACIKHRRLFLVFALLAGVLLGCWRGSLELRALTAYQQFYGKKITLQATVNEDASYGPNGDQRLHVRGVMIDNAILPGVIWISSGESRSIKRGDSVVLRGQLSKGFGNIPAAIYRAEIIRVTEPKPGDVARRIRDWFAEGIRQSIPEPQASLSVGYLVGQRSALSEDLNNQLRVVGLTHVVVASGYNLTILVGFTRRLLAPKSKYLATLAAVAMIVSFVLVTGLSPSMSRAGLVSMLGLAAWYYGRSFHPVVLLSLAAAMTAVWRPAYVWGDIGWYLSFTAFIGVIVLAPLLQDYFWGRTKQVGMLRQTLLDTLAAQILTMPIILFSFGQYATYALFANILVLPFVPVAMLLTFMAGISGLVFPGIALWIGIPAKVILDLNMRTIAWVSHLPGSHGEIAFGLGLLITSYATLFILMIYLWKATNYNFRTQEKQSLTVY